MPARTVVASRSVVSSRNVVASRTAIVSRTAALDYLLWAAFTAPDQGYSNGQVLDTPEEGVYKGQLTVVEVDGTLAIVGNKCVFTAQSTPAWGDLGFYSQAITRALGRGLLGIVNASANTTYWVPPMWTDTQGLDRPNDGEEAFYFSGGDLRVQAMAEAVFVIVDSYSASTDYQSAIILGGFSSGLPYYAGQDKASYADGAWFLIKGGAFTDWTLLWTTDQGNTATLYAAFSSYNAAGSVDSFRVPDADLSAVLQPNNLSLFATPGELDAYTPEVGGGWAEDIGDWDVADGVLKATVLGIATFTGLADCLYDAKVTTPAAGTTAGGLVLRVADLTGASEDYWYLKITPGTAGVDWELVEYVAGNPTQRASGDVDWAAATAYNIRAICDDEEISCFADGEDKISYSSAASSKTETSFGLRDEGNANMTFDIVALFARTSSVYDDALDAV